MNKFYLLLQEHFLAMRISSTNIVKDSRTRPDTQKKAEPIITEIMR